MKLLSIVAALLIVAVSTMPVRADVFDCSPDVPDPGGNLSGYMAAITFEVSGGCTPVLQSVNRCACATEPEVIACVKSAFRDGVYSHSGPSGRSRYYYRVVGALTIRNESQPGEGINDSGGEGNR